MRRDLIARDAPTSVRRACPLCPKDRPELGPGEHPAVRHTHFSEPVTHKYEDWEIVVDPVQLLAWELWCGHHVRGEEWVWISSPLGDSCEDPVYFWWVPRAVYDAAEEAS